MLASTLLALAGLVSLSTAGYVLEDDYSTDEFFSMFDFFTDSDPTNGYVTYVDQSTAQSDGLISTSNGSIYMGVDHSNVASGSGRASVRLTSKKSYTHGLIILDLSHMPGGVCGTWPAFWTVGPNWPDAGEIDIIEGVNMQLGNSMALHTSSGCSITNTGLFSGVVATPNCFVDATGQPTNAGCAIVTPNTASFGNGFNQGQGGVYATEWTSSGINIWFFPRSAIPSDIAAGTPDPANWGNPVAAFGGSCDIDTFFSDHQIVFDTTFCGDWAANVWSVDPICSLKASSCQNYVQNNPAAFANAYWSVNSLRVFQSDGSSGNSTASAPVQTPTVSASAGISASASVGISVSVPFATPAISQIPTTGFSRGGNGRHTVTWGQAAKFAAGAAAETSVQTQSEAQAATQTQEAATSTAVTDAGAAAVTVSSDGGVFEADPNGAEAVYTEFVTVTALTYEEFPKKDKRVAERELAPVMEKRAPVPVEVEGQLEEKKRDDSAHLLKHKRAHGHVHRHLFRRAAAAAAAAAKLVDE